MGAMLALNAEAPTLALEGVHGGAARRSRPPEIRGFARRLDEFRALDCDVLGVSVDDVASHRQWAAELGGVPFPLLADPGGAASRAWGVLDEQDGRAWRGAFVVSPQGRVGSVPGGRGGGGRAGG